MRAKHLLLLTLCMTGCGISHEGETVEAPTVPDENEMPVTPMAPEVPRAPEAPACQASVGPQVLARGTYERTDNSLDLAIDGVGFFILRNGDEFFYTRNGELRMDDQGRLRSVDESYFQWMTDGVLSNAIIPFRETVPAHATERVDVDGLLDAFTSAITPWNPSSPRESSQLAQNVTVYDALGEEHQLTIFFALTGTYEWAWHLMYENRDVGGGTLYFMSSGLLDQATNTENVIIEVPDAPALSITFDFAQSAPRPGILEGGILMFPNRTYVTGVSQDGYGTGALWGIRVDASGEVSGSFSNGLQRPLGRIALAMFDALTLLKIAFDDKLMATDRSGQARLGFPTEGGRGAIMAGVLEHVLLTPSECGP